MVGRWRLVLNGDNEFFDREMEKIDRLIPFSGRFMLYFCYNSVILLYNESNQTRALLRIKNRNLIEIT